MVKIIRRETRKRGFFGWIALLVFLAFNAIMALALFSAVQAVGEMPTGPTEAARAGHAIGATLGFSAILWLWVLGDIILGAFVLLTRGKKITVEEHVD